MNNRISDIKDDFTTSSIKLAFTKIPLVSKPILLATSLLTASLLITGCSKNDSAETATIEDTTESASVENTSAPVEETVAANADGITNVGNDGNKTQNAASETSMPSPNSDTPTLAAEQPSIVTNPTEPGTPEDTVKQALNTLYYGDVEDAVGYYRVEMDDFEQQLANTQSAFQQTVESVTITNTQYSVDRIRATIIGELKLKGQSEPTPLTYQLRKVGKEWKILG